MKPEILTLSHPLYPEHTADLLWFPAFYDETKAAALFQQLRHEIAWEEKTIKLFGKEVMQPRLVAFYGDEGVAYTYSGKTNIAMPWTATLQSIVSDIAQQTGMSYNSVLINYYRNGQDSMGWHSDDEKELGEKPLVASLSLGVTRRFAFRHKLDKKHTFVMPLTEGSLLVMPASAQKFWQHAIPKTTQQGERINLSFRKIVTDRATP